MRFPCRSRYFRLVSNPIAADIEPLSELPPRSTYCTLVDRDAVAFENAPVSLLLPNDNLVSLVK
jgi:hypothetical protein